MRPVLAAAILVLAGCGHVVQDFDFAKPPCQAYLDKDAEKVEVRYLGSGGLFVRWRGESILLGPQFSNPSLFRAGLGRSKFDAPRIRRALDDLKLGANEVRAILIGHSHYDHIGDVPIVARQPNIDGARIYVNAVGDKLLRAYPDVQSRTTIIRGWDTFDISPSFRVRVIPSGHAPQLCRWNVWPCVYGAGDVAQSWTTAWEKHRLSGFKGGDPVAFDVELRDGDTTRFRIYYNDASPGFPLGQTTGDVDLAVLTMAQWRFVRDYPRHLLTAFNARHVLISHWDNFFSKDEEHYPFVANLSDASAAKFLGIVEKHTAGTGKPTNVVCGVKTEHWTMPVPRSSLLFNPR